MPKRSAALATEGSGSVSAFLTKRSTAARCASGSITLARALSALDRKRGTLELTSLVRLLITISASVCLALSSWSHTYLP